jgi:hypothetical protein
MDWMSDIKTFLKRYFIHGEPTALDFRLKYVISMVGRPILPN